MVRTSWTVYITPPSVALCCLWFSSALSVCSDLATCCDCMCHERCAVTLKLVFWCRYPTPYHAEFSECWQPPVPSCVCHSTLQLIYWLRFIFAWPLTCCCQGAHCINERRSSAHLSGISAFDTWHIQIQDSALDFYCRDVRDWYGPSFDKTNHKDVHRPSILRYWPHTRGHRNKQSGESPVYSCHMLLVWMHTTGM